ncbi:chitin synthase chs-2-like [Branchiostoma floridae]|uniref:chitin synthase n=1 Tax=Branchiostoma floridae TaxID=7739 RepID=A0A9J7KSW1_BRAFL|nr:chitin synthase chs-2-like [Branchiostoma floridae]
MPSVTPALSVVLSNGILFVPIVSHTAQNITVLWKQKKKRHCRRISRLVTCVFCVLACGGLVGVWCYFRKQKYVEETVVSLLLLSTAWAPKLQEYQTECLRASKSSKPDHDNSRWKVGILNNLVKLVSALVIPDLLTYVGLTDMCSTWVWIKPNLYAHFTIDHPAMVSFIVNVTASFAGYILAWTACALRMGFFGFALPAFLSTVVTGIIFVKPICSTMNFIHPDTCLMFEGEDFAWDVGVGLGLLLVQFFTTTWFVMRSPTIVMEREAQLFWLPGYNSVFPAQWMLLSRKNRNTKGEDFTTRKKTKQNTHVYICTTMYHEAEYEMEQLLTSLRGVAESQVGERTFESHIFFDGGCKQGQPSQWALQLLSLMDHTLKDGNSKESIISQCTKYETPYGLQLHWDLHYGNGETESGMSFNIHLKDNTLVKNKKRWSQVMYMSYVLDYAVYFSPIGVESKAIPDTDMKTNPVLGQDSFNGPHRARLHMKRDANGGGGWTAEEFNDYQYLQIDLGEEMVFTGVITQGKAGTNEWVTKYRLLYIDDGEQWQYYRDNSGQPVEFAGNRDADTPVRQLLDKPITTRFVRFNPVQWANRISMRVEVLGYSAADKDRDKFMLATDADVKFSPQSAKALLDIMTRDPNVGAVCARTHPLGSGPLVWYQMFDYAVGHWFQKVANSVLGTVLCCPGCFSVYRAKAVRDALPTYATKVTKAEEFLTKDMGEDRWFCTLLVEKGWRLEYTAVSEDSTYCPEEFDEFFNQRRRWIPSTVANQLELLRKWANGQMINDYISRLFILYQGFLLFSTMIGPSTVILIIAAGLELVVGNIGGSIIPTVVILFLVFVAYALLCVYTTQETQLKWAKILTMLFGVQLVFFNVHSCLECLSSYCDDCKMLDCTPPLDWTPGNVTTWISECISDLGTFATNISKHFGRYDGFQLSLATKNEMCDEFDGPNGNHQMERDCVIIYTQFQDKIQNAENAPTPSAPPTILQQLPLPISVIYFLGLAVLYVITALLHPSEFMTLVYGFVYLLSLPSGYILLIIYSVCNMTDRSWGSA